MTVDLFLGEGVSFVPQDQELPTSGVSINSNNKRESLMLELDLANTVRGCWFVSRKEASTELGETQCCHF